MKHGKIGALLAAERERRCEEQHRNDDEDALGPCPRATGETGADRAEEHAHRVPRVREREQAHAVFALEARGPCIEDHVECA